MRLFKAYLQDIKQKRILFKEINWPKRCTHLLSQKQQQQKKKEMENDVNKTITT